MALRVLSAIMFFPRGGSAHVARALAQGLRKHGCEVTLLAGTRTDLDSHGDAREFYGDVHAVSFDAALASADPMRYEGPPGAAPMHPSFEERPDAPDKVFAALDDLDYERQVRAWSREFEGAGIDDADVLHLHHLTPLNEAAARVAPHIPIVGQLHGTELLMLERIVSEAPSGWPYAERWAQRMRAWADRCQRLLVAPAGVERALSLLELPRGRVLPFANGVDVELFSPRAIDRHVFWRRVLVEEPRGALPGQPAGSVRYSEAEAQRLAGGVVLLYVGRFTAVKRLDRLIGAFVQAQARADTPAGLVLVGGHPGEWEGEHPAAIIERLGAEHVYLAGWHSHEALPDFFGAGDAVVMASEREQFGQLLIEGMACAVPAVATRTLGPTMIIDEGTTGWLAAPDDDEALAGALVEVIDSPAQRAQRGRAAREAVLERFSWSRISAQLAELLGDVAERASDTRAIRA